MQNDRSDYIIKTFIVVFTVWLQMMLIGTHVISFNRHKMPLLRQTPTTAMSQNIRLYVS